MEENFTELIDTENSQIEELLFLLDNFHVSDEQYDEFSTVYADTPRS